MQYRHYSVTESVSNIPFRQVRTLEDRNKIKQLNRRNRHDEGGYKIDCVSAIFYFSEDADGIDLARRIKADFQVISDITDEHIKMHADRKDGEVRVELKLRSNYPGLSKVHLEPFCEMLDQALYAAYAGPAPQPNT